MAEAGAVLELQVEARRRCRGSAPPAAPGSKTSPSCVPASVRVARWRWLRRCCACLAGPSSLQVQEGLAKVLAVAAEVEAGDREQRLDVLLLVDQEVVLDLLADRRAVRVGRARRQRELPDHRCPGPRPAGSTSAGAGRAEHGHDQDGIEDKSAGSGRPITRPSSPVACPAPREVAVEPAEEAAPLLAVALDRLQESWRRAPASGSARPAPTAPSTRRW